MLELINWRSQTHWYFRLSEKQTFNGPTLGSVRALQTYGPISSRGCLLEEPASQWEACIYIHTFATHGPISAC